MEMDHTLAPATGARERRCPPVAVSEESLLGDVRVQRVVQRARHRGIPAWERRRPRGRVESATGSVPKVHSVAAMVGRGTAHRSPRRAATAASVWRSMPFWLP
jgi:hypothetical protein